MPTRALLGFDCISVVKPFLGEAFRALTSDLQRAVAIRYRIKPFDPTTQKAHKRADRVAAASEAVHVVGWTRDEVRHTLRIPLTSRLRSTRSSRCTAARHGNRGRRRSRRSVFLPSCAGLVA